MSIRARTKYVVLGNPVLRRVGLSLLNSPRVTGNGLYRYAYSRQIQRVVDSCSTRPQLMTVELTNACNLKCTFCPHKDMNRSVGFMDASLYRSIIDQCAELGVVNLCLSGTGEPLLYPRLEEAISYARSRGIKTMTVITNGTLMTPDISRLLVRSGVGVVRISVDAAREETYRKLKPPGELTTVRNNIANLTAERAAAAMWRQTNGKPLVVAKFMVEEDNKSEVEMFKKEWKNLADKLLITFPHNWGGKIDVPAPERLRNRGPCVMPFRHLVVLWDGRVPLCCLDGEGEVVLGDARRSTLSEIWQGETVSRIRREHLAGQSESLPLCEACYFHDPWWGY